MGANTKIEWATDTHNFYWGCAKVSPGCSGCYAEGVASRFADTIGRGEVVDKRGRWTGKLARSKDFYAPLRWRAPKDGTRRRIFVNSMSDTFHESLPHKEIGDMISVMRDARKHDFLVLTKRAHRMYEWIAGHKKHTDLRFFLAGLPLPNVWLGVSVENQETADERIPWLLKTPAAVRWLSVEPMLAPVVLPREFLALGKDAWVVCGGESGAKARPMESRWALDLRKQCADAGVAYFFKQGSQNNWKSYKDFNSFPRDLQIRQFPT